MKSALTAPRLVVVLLALACSDAATVKPDDWGRAKTGDLVLSVAVDGVLEATRSSSVVPPTLPDTWQFKIASLTADGKVVKKGEPVVAFDARDLIKRRADAEAERDAAAKEIARRRGDLYVAGRDLELRLAEAEANQRKAEMKADGSVVASGMIDVQIARIDAQLARETTLGTRARLAYNQRRTAAELDTLRRRFERAEGRLAEIVKAIARFEVPAPGDGTVVIGGWRGEKRKVGDQVWRGETVLEIADLAEMRAKGEVDEIDMAHVALGQRASLRLDAHPDDEFSGKVTRIGDTISASSGDPHLSVLRLDVAFEKTDPLRMRPGMHFRGSIETGRRPAVPLVPIEAVFVRPDGPVVFVRRGTSVERRRVELGERNATLVEVKRGVGDGEEVALRDPERPSRGGAEASR